MLGFILVCLFCAGILLFFVGLGKLASYYERQSKNMLSEQSNDLQ